MRLRPHHILCVQGFQGKGYNEEFIANMKNVVEIIKALPNLEVELTDECDVICSTCPHREGKVCSKTDVNDMDAEVLKEFGLGTERSVSIEILLSKELSDSGKVCGKCEWQAVCSYFLNHPARVVHHEEVTEKTASHPSFKLTGKQQT